MDYFHIELILQNVFSNSTIFISSITIIGKVDYIHRLGRKGCIGEPTGTYDVTSDVVNSNFEGEQTTQHCGRMYTHILTHTAVVL